MKITQLSIQELSNILPSLDKAIVVGADGTGKTTLINNKAQRQRVFKFHRDNVHLFFNGDKNKLISNYDIFDRHPIIDYKLYDVARDKNISHLNVHQEIKSLNLFNDNFYNDIVKYKNIIWLKKPKINILSENNRDPDWVKDNIKKIYLAYESFFFELKKHPIDITIYEEI